MDLDRGPHVIAAGAAVDRLAERYRGRVSAEAARAAFEDAYRGLRSSARVTSYLPLLAERAAMRTIDELLKHSHAAPGSSPTPGRSAADGETIAAQGEGRS